MLNTSLVSQEKEYIFNYIWQEVQLYLKNFNFSMIYRVNLIDQMKKMVNTDIIFRVLISDG